MAQEASSYRQALLDARTEFKQARERLSELEAERELLTAKIAALRRTITALAAMCSETAPALDALGITESVTEVMERSQVSLTTRDVMLALDNIGFDLAGQKNAAAAVHTVLSRLERKGIVKRAESGKDIVWRGPNYDADVDTEIPF